MSFNPLNCRACGVCDNSQIDYDPLNNIDKNPPQYCLGECNNTNSGTQKELKKFAKWIFQILDNEKFISSLLDTTNMARKYYNERKFYCNSFNLKVNKFDGSCNNIGQENVRVTVWLSGGQKQNCLINGVDITKKNVINLMEILPQNYLPSSFAGNRGLKWSKTVTPSDHVYPVTNPYLPPRTLSDSEKVIYYYLKHMNWFTGLLGALKRSIVDHAEFKFYCKKFVFPADIYCGSQDDRTLIATGTFLRQVYSIYLRNRAVSINHILPKPVAI